MKFVNAFDTGGANLGESHTKSMGDGLVDIRAKAQEGSGRGCFVIWMVNVNVGGTKRFDRIYKG
ncbi:hypothetical protein A130_13050 [Vibrio genomosp. F6 str. FF-238]|uniref:Uncharacterized protein n=1 Tax=Vibrio genomosp. F6 str. FF-238 TaxID=1191298 RepID=A0A1E5D4U0_9VIBR|nr:hypothetical protein A130_13050 [Vibrio genomosp. F6 str. FF-238]